MGNIVSVSDVSTKKSVQANAYYPSGTPMSQSSGQHVQSYKYNVKEYVEMYGYDTYNYNYRQYYSTIGQFTSIDPLAESAPYRTPYAFAANNPVNNIDLLGLFPKKLQKNDWVAIDNDGNVAVFDCNHRAYGYDANCYRLCTGWVCKDSTIKIATPIYDIAAERFSVIEISKNTAYGFNSDNMLIEVADNNNKKYWIEPYKIAETDTLSKNIVLEDDQKVYYIDVLDYFINKSYPDRYYNTNKMNYYWVDLSSSWASNIVYLWLFLVVTMIVTLMMLFGFMIKMSVRNQRY